MTDAYVHVLLQAGSVSEAAEEIAAADSVAAAHTVTGEYDLIAQLDLDDRSNLPNVVVDEIHPVAGVVDTVTNVAFEP